MNRVFADNALEQVPGQTPVPTEDDTQRTRTRDSLLLIARMQIADRTGIHDVRVRNLSEGGLMLEWDRAMPVGTAVTLDMRGLGEVAGRVVWATEGRVGVALDQPIDPKKARKPVGGGRTTPEYAKPVR